jgi:hypothetical protein
MALQARIVDVREEDNGVAFAVKVDYYDDAAPDVVLFTQPGEWWTFDGAQGLDYAKEVITTYGRNRMATLAAIDDFAGQSFAL